MSRELSYQKYEPSWGAEPVPPIPEVPIFELMQISARKDPDKPAVIFLDQPTTYRELDEFSNRVAMHLIERGVKKGDKVATVLPNCTQQIIVFYAIMKVGAIAVTCNVMLKSDELQYMLEESEVRVIFTLDLVFPVVKAAADPAGISDIVTVHVKDFSKPTAAIPPLLALDKAPVAGATDFMDLIAEDKGLPPRWACDVKNDLAMILYTSGTTGFPKGAMITHYNLCACTVITSCVMLGCRKDDVLLLLFPLFHIGSYALMLLPAFYTGATLVPVPNFDAGVVLDLIQRDKITVLIFPPTAYIGILNHPDFPKSNLSSVRFTAAAGAPVPPSLQQEWQDKVGTYLYAGLGATETTGTAPGIVEMAHQQKFATGTLGVTSHELKIVDPEGNTVPRNTTGEILHRGPGICLGYWKKPDETRQQFTDDGWWRSGDAGYMDDDGFVYFVERLKDLIIASGYNIAPAEVENSIYKHPAVQEVGVVGIPHQYRGETVKAFIVLKDEYKGKVTEEEIIAFCRDKMAVYKAPTEVAFIDTIPKTLSGKVLRRMLRELHAKQQG
jgi:long-chain acyl-CoA synthetase